MPDLGRGAVAEPTGWALAAAGTSESLAAPPSHPLSLYPALSLAVSSRETNLCLIVALLSNRLHPWQGKTRRRQKYSCHSFESYLQNVHTEGLCSCYTRRLSR